MNALVAFTQAQLSLLKKTIAKDTNSTEFDMFVELCKARQLNPLVRQAYAFVFHKDDEKKRQMTVIVSRDGQRSIAERTGCYRPDEKAPRFVFDESAKSEANPLGLVSAEVIVYKHTHGQWFPVTEIAYWEEYAPIKEIWENNRPTGRFELDKKKDGWRKMPRIMLAKCAEMAALRKAFPDDFGGLYAQEEMDRSEVLDLSPSEWVEKSEKDDRLAKIGGPALLIDWLNGSQRERVPFGQFADRCIQFIRSNAEEPLAIRAWKDKNSVELREFWAHSKADALAINREIENATSLKTVEAA